jgi:FMN phosphatase YigB (HAD superfamily)
MKEKMGRISSRLIIVCRVFMASPVSMTKRTLAHCRRWGFGNTLRRIASEFRLYGTRHGARRSASDAELWNLEAVAPDDRKNPGKIAVHAHVFYPDLIDEIHAALATIPYPFDLYVSVVDEKAARACAENFPRLFAPARRNQDGKLVVEIVPNRGRDIAPFIVHFGARLAKYDFIAHLHSKKTLHDKAATPGNDWRKYLYASILGDTDRVRRIFGLFARHPAIGIVYPLNFLPSFTNTWLANRAAGMAWCARLGFTPPPPQTYFHYPVGSMFWARGKALLPLFQAGISIQDFPEEKGQKDGTLAHVIERLFALSARRQGFSPAVLKPKFPPYSGWSSWGVDVYLAQGFSSVAAKLNLPGLKAVVFDVFDTLLTRPCLDPETAKAIVAVRARREPGLPVDANFPFARRQAEGLARERLGHDVNLPEIYASLREILNLGDEQAERLRLLETEIEASLMSTRADVVDLLRLARAKGLRVLLASDMFLTRPEILAMLARHDIVMERDFDALYLSNEVNARKDDGRLYALMMERESLKKPSEFLMIGDNERSDIQIPLDMGANALHVMSPVGIAHALPRWSELFRKTPSATVEACPENLDAHLTLGLIVRRLFGKAFHGEMPPDAESFMTEGAHGIGYGIVGPILLAFSDWLRARAQSDGVTQLAFLSREGQIFKAAYEQVCAANPSVRDAPASYMVVSRRATTLAQLGDQDAETGFPDLCELALENYHENTLESFLRYRYGYELTPETRTQLERQGLWARHRKVEIRDGDAAFLFPVLRFLAPRILANAAHERAGLLAYLKNFHLDAGKTAIVDIGYSATIQDRLCRLTGKGIDGYYMMTSQRASLVSKRHHVNIRACYGENQASTPNTLSLHRHSFLAEQLFSSDDPQIECYRLEHDATNGQETLLPCFQPQDAAERAARQVRAEIRRGAFAFIEDALVLRTTVHPGFGVPLDLTGALFDSLAQSMSAREKQVLEELALDDHYCGRGVVHCAFPGAGAVFTASPQDRATATARQAG